MKSRARSVMTAAFLLASAAAGDAATAAEAPLVGQLRTQGFTCTQLIQNGKQENAQICAVPSIATKNKKNGKSFSYPGPVAFIVPDDTGSVTDILFYVHGWQNVCNERTIREPARLAEDFNLYAQMKESGVKDAVMAIPLGTGNNRRYSFNTTLRPHFGSFMRWSADQLHANKARSHIAGHSGAGLIISSGLVNSTQAGSTKIGSIILLDATYAPKKSMNRRTEQWGDIIAANPGVRIHSVYVPGSATERLSRALQKKFPANVVVIPATIEALPGEEKPVGHCAVPAIFYDRLLKESLAPK